MSKHNDQVSMQHMLASAREARTMANGRSRLDLDSDRMLQLALTRLVEIVGEAAARVSAVSRKNHPEIPWPDIVGMRNRVIHGYDILDLDLLWDTIEMDLPLLINQLEAIVDEKK